MLPEFTPEGELPTGVHLVDWEEFHSRFGTTTPRRVWLFGRLRALLDLSRLYRPTSSRFRVGVALSPGSQHRRISIYS